MCYKLLYLFSVSVLLITYLLFSVSYFTYIHHWNVPDFLFLSTAHFFPINDSFLWILIAATPIRVLIVL